MKQKEREIAKPGDIASWQARMRAVTLDTVNEDEIRAVLKAILEKAKGGDLQAARMILSYAIGTPPKREADAAGPTGAKPQSKQKLDVLAYRAANGLPLHRNGDGDEIDLR